jgi:hypothetical protein
LSTITVSALKFGPGSTLSWELSAEIPTWINARLASGVVVRLAGVNLYGVGAVTVKVSPMAATVAGARLNETASIGGTASGFPVRIVTLPKLGAYGATTLSTRA